MFLRFFLAALLAMVLAGCVSGSGTGDTSRPTPPPPSASLSSTTSTAAPTGSTEAVAGDELEAASQAFLAWVGHLGAGDHQAAWEAMGPAAQAAVGEEAFFDSVVYEMSEGWGSWSAAQNVEFRLEEDGSGRTLLWVSGTVSPEGMTEEREVAMPVVATDDGYLMSPFEDQ